ncbi:polyribonucleotide nucleotidyltransferase [Macrococcoides bohemicum]|uniref:polyribonucleotide nucleotidyltransferase n=1 Tax=Macrococcoides bohemicum TaxID=1903056 RepID=UPI000BB56C19|nr:MULTISPECIES: polyribonucleotide nucleotidyltransferase [Macrococcus]ATD30535.1 polyribonucleotide nucleotidyltransferase [Macrococcus sp. IME1552]QRN49730.1 polyribonucleotide nucleotidyltransferase [Macrococcus bohemicus]QYA45846.1 polyribonucleotide nucleotidyltransferase [Macrococcus bohemicus]TDL37044.1 polyribonucleotide nucleotidyltransferase [Macrococcus bohemicus]
MSQEKKVFTTEWAGRPLTIETGQLAKQANGAVLVRYGDTVVLSTATASKEPRDVDFFPLMVNYEEKLYAAGKIPGGFNKREGRPGEDATLTSRLIDRPIRPLFPKGYRNDVQVISIVMSVDPNNSPEMAAMIGSSMALSVSDIPFDGPIAGVNVGLIDNKFIINPNVEAREQSILDLQVAGHFDAVNMVEAGAKEVTEEKMLEAIMFGHDEIKKLVTFQKEIIAELNPVKKEFVPVETNTEVEEAVTKQAEALNLAAAIQTQEKQAREERITAIKVQIVENFQEQGEEAIAIVNKTFDALVKAEVRRQITEDKVRPDGRRPDEIRPLSSEVGLLPRAHGSGLFTRGQTQAFSIATLGALGEHQIIDGLGVEEEKRYMHHYNFPNFSVGETGPVRAPGRREIGHGALGERALLQVIPDEKEFPYTIRVVSEVLESNGSSSQASICGSTLALMDAGVPIKAPVAGIAMGLVKKDEHYTILSDIQGMEDALGDMDFKVAGTSKGITAIQMDIKIDGLSEDILREALEQARIGRLHIMEHMLSTISEPSASLSPYAPKIKIIHINPDKIRDVIGPGGKKINEIIDATGVKLDIEQDGTVFIGSSDEEMIAKAQELIENIVREAKVGEIYMSTVKRIEKFGAFVEIFPGKDALVHISQLAKERVNKVEDVIKMGDQFLVKVTEIDKQGRVNASRKVLLEEETKKEEK